MFSTFIIEDFPEDLYALVDELAASEGVPDSFIVTSALWSYIHRDLQRRYDELAAYLNSPIDTTVTLDSGMAKTISSFIIGESDYLDKDEINEILAALKG